MTQYILKDEHGDITAVATFQFTDSIPAERPVVQDTFGRLFYEGDPRIDVPPPVTPEERIAQIKSALAEIDARSARPLRAVAAGSATDGDHTALVALEAQAAALRDELATLE